MRRVWPWVITSQIIAGLTAACGNEPAASPPSTEADASVDRQMPLIRQVSLQIDPEIAPEQLNRPIAVSSGGHIAFVRSSRSQDHQVTIVDSLGRLTGRLGRSGQGPGELSGSLWLKFADTILAAVDLDQARLSRYHVDGTFLGTRQIKFGVRPLEVSADSFDYLDRVNGEAAEIRRAAIVSKQDRILVPATDTFLPKVTAGNRAAGLDVPPYGAHGAVVALADPISYVIQYFSSEGKPVGSVRREIEARHRTPAEIARDAEAIESRQRTFRTPDGRRMPMPGTQARIDSLPLQTLPHFSRNGVGFDARRRLWVIGEANDSTFADVFADTAFLGRQMLPCSDHRRSVALNGRWLVLLCAARDTSDVEAEIQLYRIDEPN